MIWLIASPVKKQPNQTEIRLIFQDSIVRGMSKWALKEEGDSLSTARWR